MIYPKTIITLLATVAYLGYHVTSTPLATQSGDEPQVIPGPGLPSLESLGLR